MHDYLKSGRQAIRLLYFLVVGLAITNSISILFNAGNVFELPSMDSALLFIVFFSFVSRFFLGAYRVLSYDIDLELRRGKIVTDVVALFLQALAFYTYSLNFSDLSASMWTILIILALDLVWLILLAALFQITDRTSGQWAIHNLVVGLVVGLNLYLWNDLTILLVVSLIAFIADFGFNYNFYLSLKTSPGLRIFVAGPYGDEEPQEKIRENVEAAKRVGKELALKGHFPFIPHTMLHGWEMDKRFTVEVFKAIDYQWLAFCDALFFIASSPGADEEKKIATRKGLQIFTDLAKVPNAKTRRAPKF